MRILIVTRNLPPLVGGMERLNWHMAAELSKVADVRVVGPARSAATAPEGVIIREAPLKPLWRFLLRARSLARHEAKVWKPDIVLAGSGLTAPIVRSAARTCGARTAAYVHGLDVAVRHPVYRAVWLPAIRRMDRIIANSHATAKLCEGIGVNAARIGIVHPGVDLPSLTAIPLDPPSQAKGEAESQSSAANGENESLPPAAKGQGRLPPSAAKGECRSPPSAAKGEGRSPPSAAKGEGWLPPSAGRGSRAARGDALSAPQEFRQRHNLGSRPLLLSVGRLSARKGLREFVTNCMPRIVAAQPDVMLLIVGDAPKDALHAAAQTPASIQAAADAIGVADRVAFLGKVSDTELDDAYAASDVHVFPVRAVPDDVEGFGMVAVEAAAHGLLTVAFATGGVVDAVAEGQSGYLVAMGDYPAFAGAVVRALSVGGGLSRSCTAFAQQFAWPRFGEQLTGQLDIGTLH